MSDSPNFTFERVKQEVEKIILMRLFEKKVDGYTLEMAEEITAMVMALHDPDNPPLTEEQLSRMRRWNQ